MQLQTLSCLGRCLITRSTRRSTRPVTCPIGVGLDLVEKPWLQLHRLVRLAICYGSNWVGGCWWVWRMGYFDFNTVHELSLISKKKLNQPDFQAWSTCTTERWKKLSHGLTGRSLTLFVFLNLFSAAPFPYHHPVLGNFVVHVGPARGDEWPMEVMDEVHGSYLVKLSFCSRQKAFAPAIRFLGII